MKLRNKKTGEIVVFGEGIVDLHQIGCNNVAEMMDAGWEDVPEEPKDFWYIDSGGEVYETTYLTVNDKSSLRSFGNYFETREEAEKAVEKLKALKRLKDKGFKFIGVRTLGKVIDFDIPEPYNLVGFHKYERSKDETEFYDDLLLLFGGE